MYLFARIVRVRSGRHITLRDAGHVVHQDARLHLVDQGHDEETAGVQRHLQDDLYGSASLAERQAVQVRGPEVLTGADSAILDGAFVVVIGPGRHVVVCTRLIVRSVFRSAVVADLDRFGVAFGRRPRGIVLGVLAALTIAA